MPTGWSKSSLRLDFDLPGLIDQMPKLKDEPLDGFSDPISLPGSPEQANAWQAGNRSWWESHPMRYDWTQEVPAAEFSPAFYDEIDRRFFSLSRAYLPWKKIPFEGLIPFEALRTARVLEVGVGNGSHAGLLARHARSFVGIDLTCYAARSTQRRFQWKNLPGAVAQMDAEKLAFPDNSFDFVWSWGVIHHSSDTRQALGEIRRVLRPGKQAVVMVYHRSWWNWYVLFGLVRGVLMREFRHSRSIHEIAQKWTDGMLARYYTVPEWRTLAGEHFEVTRIRILGNKSDLLPLPPGKTKDGCLRMTPDGISRLFTNQLRFGSFLVSTLTKRPQGSRPL